jgi:phenylpropionate dioxygenase-like ring-hydroxylating dioxygenase large terminal subunit
MQFLRNAWYVAAWPDEVKRGELFHRMILDEPIVFYRQEDGTPIALHDRCPHRFIPLHRGKLHGDVLECAYHGLCFDGSGKCVKNPHGDGKIPAAAKVRSYPVVEKHTILWIWMGDAPADESRIPDYSMLDPSGGYRTSRGATVIKAHYELIGENLLDLSHVALLHEGLLGSREMLDGQFELKQEGDTLHSNRWSPNVPVPGVFDMLFRRDGKPVDMWMNMRWTPPGSFLLDVGVQAPGTSRDEGAWYYGIHLLTPESPRSTHYHFAAARPPGPELDPEINAKLAAMRRIAFEEQDKPLIEVQQEWMRGAEFWSLKPVLLSVDAAPVRMRRILEKLIKDERAVEKSAA